MRPSLPPAGPSGTGSAARRKVVLDRGNLRVKIGDLARRRERQLVKPGRIHRVDREPRQRQIWKSGRAIGSVQCPFEHRYDIVSFDQVQDGSDFADERLMRGFESRVDA